MKAENTLGALLEALVNRVSHPRGRVLAFLAKSRVTVDQAILLNHAQTQPGSTPTSLAEKMNISLPSASQMIERLVGEGLARRIEDPDDRRKRTIELTRKASTFLERFSAIRVEEFESATEGLSERTRRKLATAIEEALKELGEFSNHDER
jgi:DNA-binding MarR family transcriptional regulator